MLRDGAANLNKAIKTTARNGARKKTCQVSAHLKGNVTNLRHERHNRRSGKGTACRARSWKGGAS